MKILCVLVLVVVIVMIVVFTSCIKREEETKNEKELVSKITMVSANSDVVMIHIGGSGKCTIDWGDGTSEIQTLSSYPSQMYSHNYIGVSTRPITIVYENITHMAFFEQFTSLNVSGCTTLESMTCYDTQLTNLDISGCTALHSLTCYDTQLTNLDVSGCTALFFLKCKFNSQLANLDVSGCNALLNLDCCYNQLTSLDVSCCKKLTLLICRYNQLEAVALDNLFSSLHSESKYQTILIDGNPGVDGCNQSIAKDKGWDVY